MALVIVLSFVVLLTGLMVAYLSRAMNNLNLSDSSFHKAKADQLARGALDIITADLKQEIVNSSTVVTSGNFTFFDPRDPFKTQPVRHPSASGTSNVFPTLVRVSETGTIPQPGVDHAASIASTTGTSANGRYITTARWNAPLLLRRSGTTGSDSTPDPTFPIPKWVYVTDKGPVVLTSPTNAVTGRYAYTIYDSGGLLDINVAGYPSTLPALDDHPSPDPQKFGWFGHAHKGVLAFADITALGLTQEASDTLIGWRNYASTKPSGQFPANGTGGFTFNTQSVAGYFDTIMSNTTGFTQVSGVAWSNATDQGILSRQQLIALQRDLKPIGFPIDALQHLGTFSRALTAPSWKPHYNSSDPTYSGTSSIIGTAFKYLDVSNSDQGDKAVNPSITRVRHTQGKSIDRYDDEGTKFTYFVQDGEALVQRRFSLAKLRWLGHDGINTVDYPGLSPDAVRTCFGLVWEATPSDGRARWKYAEGKPGTNNILTLSEVASAGREPNFFELLKAGILEGSLGGHPGQIPDAGKFEGPIGEAFQVYSADRDRHVIQIGANIIDQSDPDNFPTAIYFKREHISGLSNSETEFFDTLFGMENLPQFHKFSFIAVGTQVTGSSTTHGSEGLMKCYLASEVWNPHAKLAVGDGPSDPQHPTPAILRLVVYGAASIYNICGDPTLNDPQWEGDQNPMNFGYNYQTDSKGDTDRNVIVFANPRDGTTPRPLWVRPAVITCRDPVKPDLEIIYEITGRGPAPENRYPSTSLKKPTNPFPFLGFYLGQFAIWEDYPDSSSAKDGYHAMLIPEPSLTFVLEYYDGAKWFPYHSMSRIVNSQPDEISGQDFWIGRRGGWTSCNAHVDPRTGRFSGSSAQHRTGATHFWPANASIWFHPGFTINKDTDKDYLQGRNTIGKFYPRKQSGLFHYQATSFPEVGEWMLNRMGFVGTGGVPDPDLPNSNYRYADPDGVFRPGDAWRAKPITSQSVAESTAGDGMLTFHYDLTPDELNVAGGIPYPDIKESDIRRRPLILNRPFRSVGELGYVFRDLPFKSLDFWSKRSGDGALLDLFSVREEPLVVAGKIDLNSASVEVLTAIISGALQGDGETTTSANEAFVDSQSTSREAQEVAKEIFRRLHLDPSDPDYVKSIGDRSMLLELSDAIQTGFANSAGNSDADRRNKRYAEAPLRALSDVNGTRTWNLMIDVIAQSGVFPSGANDLASSFVVNGERRYWLHLAIDRFSGEIVDQRIETVYE